MLDFLIPDHIRNTEQKKFAERYYLKHDESLIRVRILDPSFFVHSSIKDLSIPLSDFERTDWPADYVFITENKMNFLTLPSVSSAIAIWSGGGFKVSYLKNVHWLTNKHIFYWGDIDEHGFQILHQIRCYYPGTRSLMMDIDTFQTFQEFSVPGERNKAIHLDQLNAEEMQLYNLLKSRDASNRLEQENIPQQYADKIFNRLK